MLEEVDVFSMISTSNTVHSVKTSHGALLVQFFMFCVSVEVLIVKKRKRDYNTEHRMGIFQLTEMNLLICKLHCSFC